MVEVKKSINMRLDLTEAEWERYLSLKDVYVKIKRSFRDGRVIEMSARLPEFADPLPYYEVLDKIIMQMEESGDRGQEI